VSRPLARRAGRRRGGLVAAGAASLAAHAVVLAAMVLGWTKPVVTAETHPIAITLVALRPPPPPPPAPSRKSPAPKRPPPRFTARRSPPADDSTPIQPAAFPSPTATDLEGATEAGGGDGTGDGAGGDCDMTRRVQSALRKDPLVRAAVADAERDGAGGRTIWVWNGDWVRSNTEDGKGLAAVREAMMWEIAFAPAPCRSRPMRGLVLLAVSDAPGAPRLAVGVGGWRWSDLLRGGR
jgi:hypothetical protein